MCNNFSSVSWEMWQRMRKKATSLAAGVQREKSVASESLLEELNLYSSVTISQMRKGER